MVSRTAQVSSVMDPNRYYNLLFCTSYFFLCLFVCSFMMVVAHNNINAVQAHTPLDDFFHRYFPQLLGLGMEMSELVALTLLFLG